MEPKPIRIRPPMIIPKCIVFAPAAEIRAPTMMNVEQMIAAYVAPQ